MRGASGGAFAIAGLPILILAGYVTLVLKWEDFADYDDSFFTLVTLRGHNFVPPIWPAESRFFPLGQQEFNVVRHFTSSILGYHAVPLAELVILCCILFFLDNELNISARIALAAVYLLAPSAVTSFTGLVFPDRNVVFWLACLLLFVKFFEKTQGTIWAAATAICAQNTIYYKETAFLLVLGFAGGRLILRCRGENGRGWNYHRLREKESRLDVCLVCLTLIFVLLYVTVMSGHPHMRYAQLYGFSWGDALFYYLRIDPLGFLFVAIALARAYRILLRRSAPDLFWDGLALGGVACWAAYLYLRLCLPYYMAPVDFIAVLYVGRLIILSWRKIPVAQSHPWLSSFCY